MLIDFKRLTAAPFLGVNADAYTHTHTRTRTKVFVGRQIGLFGFENRRDGSLWRGLSQIKALRPTTEMVEEKWLSAASTL